MNAGIRNEQSFDLKLAPSVRQLILHQQCCLFCFLSRHTLVYQRFLILTVYVIPFATKQIEAILKWITDIFFWFALSHYSIHILLFSLSVIFFATVFLSS